MFGIRRRHCLLDRTTNCTFLVLMPNCEKNVKSFDSKLHSSWISLDKSILWRLTWLGHLDLIWSRGGHKCVWAWGRCQMRGLRGHQPASRPPGLKALACSEAEATAWCETKKEADVSPSLTHFQSLSQMEVTVGAQLEAYSMITELNIRNNCPPPSLSNWNFK